MERKHEAVKDNHFFFWFLLLSLIFLQLELCGILVVVTGSGNVTRPVLLKKQMWSEN